MYVQGALAIVFAAILWSGDSLIRQGLYTVPSMLVVALEHALGALIFLPFLILGWRHIRMMTIRQWVVLLWLCAISGLLALFLYTKALAYVGFIPLSVVVLLQKLQPFFTIGTASIVLRERLTLRFVVTACIASIGGHLVTFGWSIPAWSDDHATVAAALMAVGAAACWGSSTVLSRYLLLEQSTATITALRLLITAFLATALALLLGQAPAAVALEPIQWGALVLIACSAGGAALGIYYWGLKRVPASHACIYELTWPMSAMVIDYIAFGKLLTPVQLIGAVILVGAMLSLPRKAS